MIIELGGKYCNLIDGMCYQITVARSTVSVVRLFAPRFLEAKKVMP